MNKVLYGEHDRKIDPTVEEFRKELAKVLGVTVIGNRITLRHSKRKEIHMIVLEVDDGRLCDYCGQSHDEYFCPKEYADEVSQ